jgi:hypothetical protein
VRCHGYLRAVGGDARTERRGHHELGRSGGVAGAVVVDAAVGVYLDNWQRLWAGRSVEHRDGDLDPLDELPTKPTGP